jgi:nitrile hydratase beta subunit
LREPEKVEAILQHGSVEAIFARGRPTARPTSVPPRFRVGDRVRARNINPTTHTRLPRYVRGRIGIVEQLRGSHVFPDTNSLGQGENPQWLYTVRFDARDLWGPEADQTVKVSVDAWEPYLEPAG